MPLRSVDLPACRTLHFAHPESTSFVHHEDHSVYDTPACRDSWTGHRIVVHDEPEPTELSVFADRWREQHAGKGVARGWLVWESREPWPHEAPAGFELSRSRVLMQDQETVVDLAPEVRELGREDEALLHDLFGTLEGDRPGVRRSYAWYIDGVMRRIEDDWGTWYGHFDRDQLVGCCAVLFDTREARLQSVMVHPEHRRKGVASHLVQACLQAYQEVSFGITYVATEADSPGEALYRSLGFRGVTWLHYAGFEP